MIGESQQGRILPDQHRVEYTVVIKQLGGTQFSLQIAPAGGDVEATPAMDVMIEINEGVPALHISPTQCGDNAANVYALPEGLVVGGEATIHRSKPPASASGHICRSKCCRCTNSPAGYSRPRYA